MSSSGSKQQSAEEEVPSLEQLLVSLSTTPRNTAHRNIELRNTLKALLLREELDGVPSGDYARLAILLAFKRRNHSKSRAEGNGDGERGFLRAILLELYDLAGEEGVSSLPADLVNVVLPLVPQYGSWRDLLVLGEDAFAQLSGDDEVDDEAPLCLPPLGQAIGRVFASQLRRDMNLVSANNELEEKEKHVPSNACKYAPHEKRHTGNTTVKHGRERSKKSTKLLRANRIQKCLADAVAKLLLSEGENGAQNHSPTLRADYRKFLSKLKAVLTDKGFVIEPLLCKQELLQINFNSANKGSLAKNRKMLEKDPAVKAKWRKSMMRNSTAVPDIDSLLEASSNIAEEMQVISDPSDRISALRVMKCIESFKSGQQEIRDNAGALLKQIATDEAKELETQMLEESLSVTVVPVVDTSSCDSMEKVVSLILAAYITARTQNLSHITVDGEVFDLPSVEHENQASPETPSSRREKEALVTSKFFEDACIVASNLFNRNEGGDVGGNNSIRIDRMRQLRQLDYLERIRLNSETALNSHGSCDNDVAKNSSGESVDLIYLTTGDMKNEINDLSSYENLIETRLQSSCSSNLRTLSLCRISEGVLNANSEVPLVLRNMPAHPNPADISLDLCLVMDLTGSMGSWMSAAKEHLVSIVNCLKNETKIGSIRVSYIGYRDWKDVGRLVCHDFVPVDLANDNLIPLMQQQQPSGGNDMEEDVLIAFRTALTDISWQSDIRVMLHMADAPAHGYGDRGDRFKDGRCPDQKVPHLSLPQTLNKLAHDKNVDLLFCRLDNSADCNAKMEKMFGEVYSDGHGFGILPMAHGASKFKDAILSTLSSSMLQAMVPPDVAGLQSFSGGTSSALLRVINSSLRESISSLSATKGDKNNDDVIGLEGVSCKMEDDDDEDSEEEGGLKGKGKSNEPRNNIERLLSELEGEDLQPVRLALGMSLNQTMKENAAAILLESGVTVQDLMTMNYPPEIIELVKEEGVKKLDKL